jgi:hypothetical protein
MADQKFVRVDEWCGYDTKEMWDREYQKALATKKEDKIRPYEAMDLSTLAKSKEDIWIINEEPNLRVNFTKALPKSVMRGLFETEEDLRAAETFKIGRKAFQNNLAQTCQYLSYFTEFYDPEKELISLYMYIKKITDNGKQSLTIEEFKKHLMGKIFRDYHIKENIYRMVEDNHYIDATIDKKTGRVFNGPDDFTNDDIKRLLAISMMLKIIIPPVEHYIVTNSIYANDDPLINNLMLSLFVDMFYSVGDQYDDYEADILQEKLFNFAEKKVRKHYKAHKIICEQQGALRGTTESSQLDRLLVKFLLTDNFFKFHFNNALSAFLKAVIETQLKFTINRVSYNYNPVQVTDEKGPDGLSGIDKLDQMQMKVDETRSIRSSKALEDVLRKLENEYGPISEDEIQFYMSRLFNLDKFHNTLINYNYAKEFGGFTELKSASIRQLMKLIIYCKRELKRKGYKELGWLMSSLLKGKVSNRLLQNTKYINKLKTSSTYRHLVEDKYGIMMEGMEDDPILKIISRILNNNYAFIEYDMPELTGETIEFNEDIISDELLNFIDEI